MLQIGEIRDNKTGLLSSQHLEWLEPTWEFFRNANHPALPQTSSTRNPAGGAQESLFKDAFPAILNVKTVWGEGLANYGPWAKSGSLFILVQSYSWEWILHFLKILKNQKKISLWIQLYEIQILVSINNVY